MEIRKMIKILIVDDEKPICDLIDLNLSSAGYHCISVQDGLKAINRIEEEDFDLVLLDIMLPGADGYDIMEYIRPLKIPVIFITAKHEVKDRVKGLKLGADDYRKRKTKYVIAITLESMVAMAAPVTPSFSGKIKIGSKIIFKIPPKATPKLASLEYPSARTRCARHAFSTVGIPPIVIVHST